MKVKSLSRVRLFLTPWTVARQAPLSMMGFSRQEYWSRLPFPSPGDLPDPGIEPGSSTLQADTLPSEPQGSPDAGQEATLEPDMEQWTGSKSGKDYIKVVCCHPAYLTSMQSISCKMPGWLKHKLESRLLGEILTTSDMQMMPL